MLALLLLAAQDTLRFKDSAKNPDIEGDVVSMTCKIVEIEVLIDGVRIKRTVDPRDLSEILPRKSIDFAKAEEAAANGDFTTAVQRLERVAADARAGELLRQSASIQIVRTHAAAENHAALIQSARALRARKADGYYVGESYESEVQSQLAAGDVKQAGETAKAFLALATAQVLPDWVRNAELSGARVSERQNQWAIALAVYRKHAKDPDVTDDTTLGEMRCLTALGDWPNLRRRADAVIKESLAKKSPTARPLIAAYTAKGDLEVQVGKSKEALLNYLQGAIVLNRGEKSPEHEVALARSSIICAKMAAAEKSKESKELYRGRAQELLRELAGFYPRSAFRGPMEKAIQESR